MIIFLDAHYTGDHAAGAGVLCADWGQCEFGEELVHVIKGPRAYVPGSLFERELPCIFPLAKEAMERGKLETVIVDGYVDLDGDRPGLGRHLWRKLGDPGVEVLGVAKSAFTGASANPVFRGDATKPLWVSSTVDVARAVRRIAALPGPYRIPDVLRQVDAVARKAATDL